MNEGIEVVTCSCCGRGINNTPEENAHFGKSPYPVDEGFMCRMRGLQINRRQLYQNDRGSIQKTDRLGYEDVLRCSR